jgi:sec-independent protein translocase protein TatA
LTIAFFNISGGEIFIIMLVVFLVFGPDKIPEIARWIGKGVGEVKKATSEIRDEISRETEDIKKHTDKIKSDLRLDDKSPAKINDKPSGEVKSEAKNEPSKKSNEPHL